MKVLYVSYDGLTDALGRSQVLPYLLELSKKGHKIHVISCEKKQVSTQEVAEVRDILALHDIGWIPLSFSTRPPWISKIADVYKIKNTALKLQKKNEYDIVHCRSYIAALAGLELKLRYNVKFVFDMRGFWANERIEGGIWSLSNPFYRAIYTYFKRKEKEFFLHSDAVVSLTHNGKGVILDLFGEAIACKTHVIPCCVDTTFFSADTIDPDQKKRLQHSLQIEKQELVISYLGSTGTWYMTDEMLLFYKRLLRYYPRAQFLFITGDTPDFILNKAAVHGIDSKRIIITRAARNEVPLYLSLSDLSLFFIKPVFSKRASSPTKQAEILSMGIPLICNAGVGDTDMIFAKDKAGLVIKDLREKDFDHAIAKIDQLLAYDPVKIRKKALDEFNLYDAAETYHNIYTSVMKRDNTQEQ